MLEEDFSLLSEAPGKSTKCLEKKREMLNEENKRKPEQRKIEQQIMNVGEKKK